MSLPIVNFLKLKEFSAAMIFAERSCQDPNVKHQNSYHLRLRHNFFQNLLKHGIKHSMQVLKIIDKHFYVNPPSRCN